MRALRTPKPARFATASATSRALAARDALSLDPTHRDWASLQLYSRESDGLATFPISLERGSQNVHVPGQDTD